MEIIVNGETRRVPDQLTAAGLIEILELGHRRLALELNGDIVPRSEHAGCPLKAGDQIEIVHAVGGG
jgi:sulfur carrier protein